jgi:hypothetical protein
MNQYEHMPLNLTEVGQKLVGHSKSADFTATRGLVIELFPFIFEASDRMSARAISRFLQEEQKIKLSQVTITRALNDPKKSWLSYFKQIEPEAITIAKWGKSRSFKYLLLTKGEFERIMSFEEVGFFSSKVARGMISVLRPDRAAAIKVMREKWFSIGLGTRQKAKEHLEEYLKALEDKF